MRGVAMLEFVVKFDGEQIGQLTFDPKWHKRDVAMQMLEWYVVQHLQPGYRQEAINRAEEESHGNRPLEDWETVETEQQAYSNHGSVVDDYAFLLINPRAKNREHVFKYKGKSFTGNMAAVLYGLSKRRHIDEARDLMNVLREDDRFQTEGDDGGLASIRYALSLLVEHGLAEKRGMGHGVRISTLGEQIVKDIEAQRKV
jgi:hypothetical protein